MSELERVPLVQREDEASKNCKMIFITGFIVVGLICIMLYQKTDIQSPIIYYREPMSTYVPENRLNPVLGKYIQIINKDHRYVPVNKIVIIDKDKNIIPLYTQNAKYTEVGEKGSVLEFELPNVNYITQMVVHLDVFNPKKGNISSSQVRICDSEMDTRWTSTKILPVEKYIDLYVSRPHYIYPIPQKILDPAMTTPDQEATLTRHLINNTW
jgi:hypothetical protein